MGIIVNKIECKKYGEVIECKIVHDFKFCRCSALLLTEGMKIHADVEIEKIGNICL